MKKKFLGLWAEVVDEVRLEEKAKRKGRPKSSNIEVGQVYKTNSGPAEVLEYKNSLRVKIKFVETGYEKSVTAQCLRSGKVRDPYYSRSKNGGYLGDSPSVVDGKQKPLHYVWKDINRRLKNDERYKDASIHAEFLEFAKFEKWHIREAENYPKGVTLSVETDIAAFLTGKPKCYGPDTAIIVPQRVNLAFSQLIQSLDGAVRAEREGECPPGVYPYGLSDQFIVRSCQDMSVFDSIEDATFYLKQMRIERFVELLREMVYPYISKDGYEKLKCLEAVIRARYINS